MQTSSNSSFPFGSNTDLATQNALMQGLGFNPQNISTNPPGAMGGFIQNSQPIGYPVFDQSLQNNFQSTPNALNMNQLNPMLMQQSMGQQLQGFNMPQNQMASQLPLQMQQQMFGANGNPIIPSFGGVWDANQIQQMNSYGGMNPLLAQSLQGAQMQTDMYGGSDAMNMAFQGMMSAQRGQLSNSERDNYNSNGVNHNRLQTGNQNEDGALRLNTVYVSNLPQNLDHEMLKTQFSKAGSIKLNSKSGMPMIWIFKDRGVPKGDALVTYDSNSSASNAVAYFKDHDFNGRRIEVRIATNAERPILAPPSTGGGQNNSGNDRRGGSNQYKIESISRNNDYESDSYDWQKRDDGGGFNKQRDFRNNNNNNNNRNNNDRNNRGPDWICAKCNNNNFSWRESCNRCQEPKAENAIEVHKQDRGRGFNGGRSNNRTVPRNSNPRNQDGGPMRGPKRSTSRPEPY